jgi:hypothetical protein
MNLLGNTITAMIALFGVLLGGLLTFRHQDRLWWRDHARHWRDIRLSTYKDFLSACRQYVTFTLEPTANIEAVPHPYNPGQVMPFFDEAGRPYKENLEASMMTVRLSPSDRIQWTPAPRWSGVLGTCSGARDTFAGQFSPRTFPEAVES